VIVPENHRCLSSRCSAQDNGTDNGAKRTTHKKRDDSPRARDVAKEVLQVLQGVLLNIYHDHDHGSGRIILCRLLNESTGVDE